MMDLKRFLRFEVSGYVTILYAFLFSLALYDLATIKSLGLLTNAKLLDYSVTGFILSAPIGFLMHQMDISIFSPFRKKRWFFHKRKVIGELEKLLGEKKKKKLSDVKYQSLLELALLEMPHIDEEISNRYSYYYARMEAGLFSPIFGFMLFLLSYFCISRAYTPNSLGSIMHFDRWSFVIITGIVIISFIILAYCPILFREINDLECQAVANSTKVTNALNNISSQGNAECSS